MLKRVCLSYDTARKGWRVNLPTFSMLPGSFLPVTDGLIDADGPLASADPKAVLAVNCSVLVEIPDDTPVDQAGDFDAGGIRDMYAGHPRFGVDDYTPPSVVAEEA